MNYLSTGIIALVVSVGVFLGIPTLQDDTSLPDETLGAFGDPFISIQLAGSPVADKILSTDGTDNIWIVNSGGGGDPNLINVTIGGTLYDRASTTNNAFFFDDGFISNASSTFIGATTTFTQRVTVGTTSPVDIETTAFYAEAVSTADHAGIFRCIDNMAVHCFMVEAPNGNDIFTIESSGEIEGIHPAPVVSPSPPTS